MAEACHGGCVARGVYDGSISGDDRGPGDEGGEFQVDAVFNIGALKAE